MRASVAFPYTAVVTVIPAVIGELDKPPDIHTMPIMPGAHFSRSPGKVLIQILIAAVYQRFVFIRLESGCVIEFVDQLLHTLSTFLIPFKFLMLV
jgi:hypothetical protein